MKSIKEKSNEYASEFVEPFVSFYTNNEVRLFEAQHEDSFEAGANYVLEEIETITKADLGSYKSQLDRIKNVIEQLKK